MQLVNPAPSYVPVAAFCKQLLPRIDASRAHGCIWQPTPAITASKPARCSFPLVSVTTCWQEVEKSWHLFFQSIWPVWKKTIANVSISGSPEAVWCQCKKGRAGCSVALSISPCPKIAKPVSNGSAQVLLACPPWIGGGFQEKKKSIYQLSINKKPQTCKDLEWFWLFPLMVIFWFEILHYIYQKIMPDFPEEFTGALLRKHVVPVLTWIKHFRSPRTTFLPFPSAPGFNSQQQNSFP